MTLELSGVTFEFTQGAEELTNSACSDVLKKIIEITGRTDMILITKTSAEKGVDKSVAVNEFCQKFAEYVIVWVTGTEFSGNAIHAMIDREVAEQTMFSCLDFVFEEGGDTHFYVYSLGAGIDALTALTGYIAGARLYDILKNEIARKAMLNAFTNTDEDLLNEMKEIIVEAMGLTKASGF